MEVSEKKAEKFRFEESPRIGNMGTVNKEWDPSPGGTKEQR